MEQQPVKNLREQIIFENENNLEKKILKPANPNENLKCVLVNESLSITAFGQRKPIRMNAEFYPYQ